MKQLTQEEIRTVSKKPYKIVIRSYRFSDRKFLYSYDIHWNTYKTLKAAEMALRDLGRGLKFKHSLIGKKGEEITYLWKYVIICF